MKPRHTAEQSTVAVNKSAQLGKTGFAALFKPKEEVVVAAVNPQNVAVAADVEPPVEKEPEPMVDIKSAIKSSQIFAKVQTQLPQASATGSPEKKEHIHYKERIIDGKVYRVHMPSDPQENFTCDGCQ